MKKLILLLFTLFLSICLHAQYSAYNDTIHHDYGTWKVENGNNIISVSAFCTVKGIDNKKNINKRGVQYRELKQEIKQPQLYEYKLYLVSKSIFESNETNTWLYNTKVFVNNKYVLKNQFPNGFIILIKHEPTLIYTYQSINKNIVFDIKWEKSVYEPRIHK